MTLTREQAVRKLKEFQRYIEELDKPKNILEVKEEGDNRLILMIDEQQAGSLYINTKKGATMYLNGGMNGHWINSNRVKVGGYLCWKPDL